MACFLVPLGEAIITTAIQKGLEKKERKAEAQGTSHIDPKAKAQGTSQTGISWSRKLSWLNKLLWGGVLLLAFEHLWHGEIVPWPPFLTAMNHPAEIGPMLREIATIGIGMAVFVTIVWVIMILIADHMVKALPKKAAPTRIFPAKMKGDA